MQTELVSQHFPGNAFLYARRNAPKPDDGAPVFFSRYLADQHALHKDAYLIRFRLRPSGSTRRTAERQDDLFSSSAAAEDVSATVNLSSVARRYPQAIGGDETRDDLWYHCLAIGYSPSYVAENADAVRSGWPRMPLPRDVASLTHSANLGRRLAALLDPQEGAGEPAPVAEVTSNRSGGRIDIDAGDLRLTAGWGHAGKGGITMPGRGRTSSRSFSEIEADSLQRYAATLGTVDATDLLNRGMLDVFLNDHTCWRNLPVTTWEYVVGGYQVLKKWLSYREFELIERALRPEEVRQFSNIARRLTTIILLTSQLDRNYESVRSAAYEMTS